MLRTAMLPATTSLPADLGHSLDPIIAAVPRISAVGRTRLERREDFFDAEAFVVPGVAPVERNCERLGTPTFFSGPLTLDATEEAIFHSTALHQFLRKHEGQSLVYPTFGAVEVKSARDDVLQAFRCLFEQGFQRF